MEEIIGVTFPILKSYIPRFFKDGRTVFIKPATVFKELKIGMRFVFYQSHEDTGCVGEAVIKQITIVDDPFYFYKIYGDKIFLTKEELKKYIEDIKKWRENRRRRRVKPRLRKWIAIELESIHKYDYPKKPKRFVPIGGQYLKREFDHRS